MHTPTSESDLALLLKDAAGPVSIRGGGTRGSATLGETLSTEGLSGITLYEPGALTIVAQAGTPLADIEAALDSENQRLAFEPMDHRALLGTTGAPTIGGVVAGNVSGPRRVQVGACRDHLLGVRFVDGSGTIIKNGGRVMKNVTGYDLVKLMAGSWGTLGVLTEVSLKVLPKPDTSACLMIDGLSDTAAVDVMAQAIGSPYEITGAAHAPKGPEGNAVTYLRIEGFAQSVTYRGAQLQHMFADHATRLDTDHEAVGKTWAWIRDVGPFHDQDGDVWRISCKPSDGPDLAARLNADGLLYDWAGGLIWACLPEGTDARARLGSFGGHATLIRGAQATKRTLSMFHPEPAAIAALSKGIRLKHDPRGILNAGLMG